MTNHRTGTKNIMEASLLRHYHVAVLSIISGLGRAGQMSVQGSLSLSLSASIEIVISYSRAATEMRMLSHNQADTDCTRCSTKNISPGSKHFNEGRFSKRPPMIFFCNKCIYVRDNASNLIQAK